MELTLEQKKIIDLVNQLPTNLKKSTLEILFQMNASIDITKNDLEKTITSPDLTREAQEKKEDMIYFSIPDKKEFFDQIDAMNEMRGGQTYYKIDTKTGEINYVPSAFDKRTIENIENYLLPACDIENFSDRKWASKVKVLEPGEAYQSGDKWIVKKKIKIKLI